MFLEALTEQQLTKIQYKEFENYRSTALSLVVVSLVIALLGAGLIKYSTLPDVMDGGFGFVYHFAGVHMLGLGCILSVASIAAVFLTGHKRSLIPTD